MSGENKIKIAIKTRWLKLAVIAIIAASITIPTNNMQFEANANPGTLTNVSATPSDHVVNSLSTYVITFALGTADVGVESVEITFPTGFDVSNAKMAKVETVYSGFPTGTLKVSGQTLIWDHNIALRPACCLLVKMTIADIVNGNTLTNQIAVATKDIKGAIIDGPTSATFQLVSTLGSDKGNERQEQNITVSMKIKKKLTLLSFKNIVDIPVYSIMIKIHEGPIRYVKASGWDREKVDATTIMIKTDDRPLIIGRNMIVILIGDKIDSGLEWTVFDSAHNIISTGLLGEQPKYEQERPQQQEQQEQSTTQNHASQSESEAWHLIAELQNVSVFGRTVRTETLCVEKLNWKISWTGGVYAVRVHGVDNNFREELWAMPNHVIADLKGCFFVFPVSADGSGAVWVYGDKNIEVKKYLPEPNPELMAQMKKAKRGEVKIGDFPAEYNHMGGSLYGDNAYYKPDYGTLGKVAHACFEESSLPFEYMPLMLVSWDVKGEFNRIQIYRELDTDSLELVYETHEPKGEFYIYDKGCYYGYVDINSMSEFVLSLIPRIASD